MAGRSVLETERLVLRELVEDDAEACYQQVTDPEVIRYTGDGGSIASVEDMRAILCAHPIADYRKYGFGRWACVLKSTGAVIGFAGLKYLEDLKEVDIGYRLLRVHWGQGLATEASRAAMNYGFTKLQLKQIIGLVHPENAASIRVLQKLGLAYVETFEYHALPTEKYLITAPS